jgi:hypothetical protein
VTDLFEEVEEQLRSDRYRKFAIRALPWLVAIAAAALIAALAYWGWQTYTVNAANKASEQYAAALDALGKNNEPQAVQLFTEVSKSPSKAYKSLALMQLGGLKIHDKQTDAAIKLFDEAAKAAPDDMIGDAARLKSAFALLDTHPYSELEARLTPLMQDGHPYRAQAREALAFAKLMKGDTAGARADFVFISQSLDAPESLKARAGAAKDLIDSGSAVAVPAAVKAALALPPAAMVAPGATGPAIAAPPQSQPQAPGPQ